LLADAGASFDERQGGGECQADKLVASGEAEEAQEQQRHRLSGHCHSGMARGALFLGAKFGPLLQLCAKEMRITLVGHSLGAGGC
jgi:hypothetical protein